jgi:hypothetical protein
MTELASVNAWRIVLPVCCTPALKAVPACLLVLQLHCVVPAAGPGHPGGCYHCSSRARLHNGSLGGQWMSKQLKVTRHAQCAQLP